MCGYVYLCVAMSSYVWLCVVMGGYVRLCAAMGGYVYQKLMRAYLKNKSQKGTGLPKRTN